MDWDKLIVALSQPVAVDDGVQVHINISREKIAVVVRYRGSGCFEAAAVAKFLKRCGYTLGSFHSSGYEAAHSGGYLRALHAVAISALLKGNPVTICCDSPGPII